jgi:hypothetical protein
MTIRQLISRNKWRIQQTRSVLKRHAMRLLRIPPAKQKTIHDWMAKGYINEPVISFVIQSHNKSKNVIQLVRKLRQFPRSETIVIADGSRLDETHRLLEACTGGMEFVLHANDLYEVIMYDRAIHMARGRYVALLQDDDDCDSLEWVEDALTLFSRFSELAILGGRDAVRILPRVVTPDGMPGEFVVDGNVCQRANMCRWEIVASSASEKLPGKEFRFVQAVNRAPLILNRNVFLEKLRHLDQSYAPCQWDDTELCLRAWVAGAKVGWYDAKLKHAFQSGGGMWTANKPLLAYQEDRNAPKIYESYGSRLDWIQSQFDQANRQQMIIQ